jgi:hypothetical protein
LHEYTSWFDDLLLSSVEESNELDLERFCSGLLTPSEITDDELLRESSLDCDAIDPSFGVLVVFTSSSVE